MEAAGLGIGAASLLALFKTCLEMYDTIECGRRFGSAYEVLTTKVGIERVRLLLWGDSVGLPGLDLHASAQAITHPALDPRLQDPRIIKAVSDVLSCMRQLFEDTSSMTRRYGLQSSEANQTFPGSLKNALVTSFRKSYTRFQEASVQRQRLATISTTARWAIKDKKRFERFVEDLRGFNDSLCALFPDLDEQVRQEMAAEIKSSTDLENLEIVEQAVTDMEANEELVEAASVRITELSQHSSNLAQDDVETIDEILGTADEGSSTIGAGGVNMDRLAKQLARLEVALRASLKGSLELSIWHSFGGRYCSFITWEGVEGDEYFAQKDKEIEYFRHSYPAWALMYAPEKKQYDQGNWADEDNEAGRKYEGRYPGTRTVEGYGADFSAWARVNEKHEAEKSWSLLRELPQHNISFLVDRLRELQVQRQLPWNDEVIRKNIETLIGPSNMSVSSNNAMDRWRSTYQVTEILGTLNRNDTFDDVRDSGSMSGIALAPGRLGLPNFLFQMVLAYELKLRVARSGDTAFGNYGPRIVAAVMAAERWLDGVLLKIPDPKQNDIQMHSLVHERQVEGLVRFAELMAWPALGELRGYVEDAYANLRAGGRLSPHLWDWLFGTMLAGNAFVFTIMSALVAATPSLSSLGAPTYYASGLVLEDRSYWRAKFVLGRVLGGLRGVKAANGWVGPCPLPVGSQNSKISKGWWRVQARDVAFKLPERLPSHADADEGAAFSGLGRVAGQTSKSEWIRTIGDPSKWVVPVGPSGTPDVVGFRALRLRPLGDATLRAGKVETSDPAPDDLEPMQRASVELTMNGAPVVFTIYSNPVFVAAPRCMDGPHAVHERDLPKLQLVRRISELPGQPRSDDERVLVIDATGQGECELAARAWCAEYGQHAVVRRGTGPCFTCTVLAASRQGLGLGCVIWA